MMRPDETLVKRLEDQLSAVSCVILRCRVDTRSGTPPLRNTAANSARCLASSLYRASSSTSMIRQSPSNFFQEIAQLDRLLVRQHDPAVHEYSVARRGLIAEDFEALAVVPVEARGVSGDAHRGEQLGDSPALILLELAPRRPDRDPDHEWEVVAFLEHRLEFLVPTFVAELGGVAHDIEQCAMEAFDHLQRLVRCECRTETRDAQEGGGCQTLDENAHHVLSNAHAFPHVPASECARDHVSHTAASARGRHGPYMKRPLCFAVCLADRIAGPATPVRSALAAPGGDGAGSHPPAPADRHQHDRYDLGRRAVSPRPEEFHRGVSRFPRPGGRRDRGPQS